MSLTEFNYLAFFSLVLLAHWLLEGRDRLQKLLLTGASYYFYATLDWRFPLLLVAFTAINWLAGLVAGNANARKAVRQGAVACAVLASVGILGYFKYLNFFAEMVNSLAAWLGHGALVPLVGVLLPVGLSFITFQALTYPVDLYAGRLEQRASLLDFALFIAFFPRLLAGPIVPASYFLPQLQRRFVPVTSDQRFEGAAQIMRGLVKKVVLADIIGSHVVDPAFGAPGSFSTAFLWLAVFGYSLQTYLDLSGYTDMALGAAHMLGLRLPPNFNRPYRATSIANFWQRWHISMSSFFATYLYQPMKAAWHLPQAVNLMIVFTAIGLWHGAGWNFIVYGMLHGALVALEHRRNRSRRARGLPLPVYQGARLALQVGLVFTVVSLARVLFRSNDLSSAWHYFGELAGSPGTSFPLSWQAGLAVAAALLLHWSPTGWRDRFTAWVARQPAWLFGAQFAGVLYMVVAFSGGAPGFIYYQF